MYFHADQVFGLVALMATLAFAVIGLCYAMLTRPVHRRIVATGISVVPFLLVLPLALPESAIASKAPQSFIEKVYSAVPEDVILVSDTSLIRAVSWSTKRADVFVIGGAGETSYGLRAAEGRGRFLEPQALAKLLDDDRGALVFCKRSCNASTLSVIPDNATSYSQGKFSAHIVLPQRARAAP